MPYKSEAQRKYFNANRKKLEAEGVDVDHWNETSKGKDMPEKKSYAAEKRAYGYSDDYGYIERVPWLGIQNRAEVLERMAKAQKLAKKQKLDLTYESSRWGEERLSPEDAYKMVEALPDSAFTGEFGYGGTDDTIPWSVSSSTRGGSKYNFRKDPLGMYDHLYGGDDDHEYDEYGNSNIPYEEKELDANGQWFANPEEAKNWEFLNEEPKKSWLGTLFPSRNAQIDATEKRAYGYADDYVIHERHLSATPNASLAEQLKYTEELKEEARLLEGNLTFTENRFADPEDYFDYDEAINRIKNQPQKKSWLSTLFPSRNAQTDAAFAGLPLFYQISRDDDKPLNYEAATPPEYLEEYLLDVQKEHLLDKQEEHLLDKQGKAMSNIQMLAKRASLQNALHGGISGAGLGLGANYLGSLAGQFLAPMGPGGDYYEKAGPGSAVDNLPMTGDMRRAARAKAMEEAYKDFKFNHGDAMFNDRTGPYMGIGAAGLAASGALTPDDEEEKRSYALSDIQLLAKEAAGRCWTGYEPVSGKKPYSDGSCQPAGGKKKKKKTEKKADGASPTLNSFLGQKASPMQSLTDAGIGAGIGGLGGALYGAMDPGEDEDGKQKSRLSSGLYGGILGGIGGAGLGAGAGQFREGGVGSKLRDQYFPQADPMSDPDKKYEGKTRDEGDKIHKEVVDGVVKKYPSDSTGSNPEIDSNMPLFDQDGVSPMTEKKRKILENLLSGQTMA